MIEKLPTVAVFLSLIALWMLLFVRLLEQRRQQVPPPGFQRFLAAIERIQREGWSEPELVKQWTNPNLPAVELEIMRHPLTHYCGYATFPTRPVSPGQDNALERSVRVHGGITYSHQLEDGRMKYGFDCGHGGDWDDPDLQDIDWLTRECELMAAGILHFKEQSNG